MKKDGKEQFQFYDSTIKRLDDLLDVQAVRISILR